MDFPFVGMMGLGQQGHERTFVLPNWKAKVRD